MSSVFIPGTPVCTTKGCHNAALRAEVKKVNQYTQHFIPKCQVHLDITKAADLQVFSAQVARYRSAAAEASQRAITNAHIERKARTEALIDRVLAAVL